MEFACGILCGTAQRSSRAVYERAAERAREVLFAHLVERNARGEILP